MAQEVAHAFSFVLELIFGEFGGLGVALRSRAASSTEKKEG